MGKELKTLKDLGCLDADHPKFCNEDGGHTYCEEDIKQEAIKWVKKCVLGCGKKVETYGYCSKCEKPEEEDGNE